MAFGELDAVVAEFACLVADRLGAGVELVEVLVGTLPPRALRLVREWAALMRAS